MPLELVGPHPFERDAESGQKCRIGVIFPEYSVLWTQLPGVHALQRLSFIERLNSQRAAKGLPALTLEEEQQICVNSVDLIFEADHILIRPAPESMDLAFAADELLQGLVSKRQVKFLSVSDARVVEAIKRRGEYWRLSSIPKQREAQEHLVLSSKVGILGRPIYYYNRLTGTRWLTFAEFEGLGRLEDTQLAQHLQEISDHAVLRNRAGRPEVDFFAAETARLSAAQFAGVAYSQLLHDVLRARFDELKERFGSAVNESFRRDDFKNNSWCQRILSALFLDGSETQTEQILSGLSPEFFLQIEWLPGGRFEEGEFLFDPIFDEAASHPEDQELQRLCDPRIRGFIFNFLRAYGDLEYINVGCLPNSLSLGRPETEGRRGVFIAEFYSRRERTAIRRYLRLQKWGVWEHLDEGKELLQAMKESDDYSDYCLDRRLGCRQLGMNLVRRVSLQRLSETYRGRNERFRNDIIRTAYFEREYLPGIATDKLPPERYSRPNYAIKLAELLGEAGGASIIVGRSFDLGTRPLFDDGDEVVREGDDGLPVEILVSDHSGAFGEYKRPLDTFAAHYARPINSRESVLPNPREFAEAYLAAFRAHALRIQSDYRKRRRAFDTLFKHCRYDTGGSFAFRWECILRRLDQTEIDSLVRAVRHHIRCLNTVTA